MINRKKIIRVKSSKLIKKWIKVFDLVNNFTKIKIIVSLIIDKTLGKNSLEVKKTVKSKQNNAMLIKRFCKSTFKVCRKL